MAWVTNCPKCGHNRVYNHDAGTCYVCTPKTGPAPKEERMPIETINTPDDDFDMEQEMKAELDATLRAVYHEAYFAVLGGGFGKIASHKDALETVRQWPAMQAELDALIGEME